MYLRGEVKFSFMASSGVNPLPEKPSGHVTAKLPCMQLEIMQEKAATQNLNCDSESRQVSMFFLFFFAFNFIKQRSKRRPSPCLYRGAASLSIM